MQHEVPDRPKQKVGIDLFDYRSPDYVLDVDYYSKLIEIRHLQWRTAKSVAHRLMSTFSGEEMIIAANMAFNSKCFKEFLKRTILKSQQAVQLTAKVMV